MNKNTLLLRYFFAKKAHEYGIFYDDHFFQILENWFDYKEKLVSEPSCNFE